MENNSLKFLYALDLEPASPDDELQGVANYVYALCYGYVGRAIDIITGGSGGEIVVVTPKTPPAPYYFIVDATSFMVDGQDSKTITSFIGYNLSYARNGVVQTTVDAEPPYFSWNSTTGLFIVTPALVAGELIALVPT